MRVFMRRPVLTVLFALAFAAGLAACGSDDEAPKVQLYPTVLDYWRPISDPNVFMAQPNAQIKLNYDLAQCRCSNFPQDYPHYAAAQVAPDLGRLAETSADRVDSATGCKTTPQGVLLECMRARGWEPTECSGRLATPGGTTCALAIHDLPAYPESYPYQNPYNQSYDSEPAPPEQRQRYP
jgi:hypothetical protein